MHRFAALVLFFALFSCKGGGREASVFSDASTNNDAQTTPTDAGSGNERGDEAILPAADIELELPYGAPALNYSLSVSADPALADIVFLVDTTSSFSEEIDRIQSDLRTLIIPSIEERIELASFGAARFEDFPIAPFGASSDRPFVLLSAVTSDADRVQTAIATLDNPLGKGGDVKESSIEALYQIGTGDGFSQGNVEYVEPYQAKTIPGGGSLGGVGFREGALHMVIHITDAPFHSQEDYLAQISGAHSLSQAMEALEQLDVIVLGIASNVAARADLEQVALLTGAVASPTEGLCATGINEQSHPSIGGQCPLVYDVNDDGTGLSETLVDAVLVFVNNLRYSQVTLQVSEDRLDFVKAIRAKNAEVPDGTPEPGYADLQAPFDGQFDSFISVGPGTTLYFELELQNTRLVPAFDYEQVFLLPISIVGDGLMLSEKTLRIVVPKATEIGDAG